MTFKVRKIGLGNDWIFGRGLHDYVMGHEKVEQMLVTRIREVKGDWFANTNIGIDYYNLLGNRGTLKELERQIDRVARATEGVLIVTEVSSEVDYKTRTAIVLIRGRTIYDKSFELSIGI